MKDSTVATRIMTAIFVVAMISSRAVLAQTKTGSAAKEELKSVAEEAVGKVLGNFIAIRTGQIKDGEQIPLPVYGDGKTAERSECHYFVSPAELTTALSRLQGVGGYYLVCRVDPKGYVHASLWEFGSDGEFDVIKDEKYESLQRYYESLGDQNLRLIGQPTGTDFQKEYTSAIKKHVLVNYLVIALRSSKGKS